MFVTHRIHSRWRRGQRQSRGSAACRPIGRRSTSSASMNSRCRQCALQAGQGGPGRRNCWREEPGPSDADMEPAMCGDVCHCSPARASAPTIGRAAPARLRRYHSQVMVWTPSWPPSSSGQICQGPIPTSRRAVAARVSEGHCSGRRPDLASRQPVPPLRAHRNGGGLRSQPAKARALTPLSASRQDGIVTIMGRLLEVGQGIETMLPISNGKELWMPWRICGSSERRSTRPPNPWEQFAERETTGAAELRCRCAGSAQPSRRMLHCRRAGPGMSRRRSAARKRALIYDRDDSRSLSYGALAGQAAGMPVPDLARIALEDPKRSRFSNSPIPGVDDTKIVTAQTAVQHRRHRARHTTRLSEDVQSSSSELVGANMRRHGEAARSPRLRFHRTGRRSQSARMNWPRIERWSHHRSKKLFRRRTHARDKLKVTSGGGSRPVPRAARASRCTPPERAGRAPTSGLRRDGDVASADAGAARMSWKRTCPIPFFLTHVSLEPRTAPHTSGQRVPDLGADATARDRRRAGPATLGIPRAPSPSNMARMGCGFGRRLRERLVAAATWIFTEGRRPGRTRCWTRGTTSGATSIIQPLHFLRERPRRARASSWLLSD